MSLENVFEIDVDIKSKTAIRTPTVTQNDTVIFIFRVFDEGRIYNIEDGSTFTVTSTRPDKQAVITVGEVTGINTIRFKLGTTELAVRGKVEAVIQVYDADGRVSTIPFKYEVLSDPSTDYIPSDNEQTLIEQVLGDGPRILADAQQATTDAYEAAEAANAAADNANQVASDVAQAIAETRQATQDATEITEIATQAEEERQVAETERQQNEDARKEAEAARDTAETERENAEALRQQQEAQRQSDTQTAISNAEEATEGAQAVADNTRYIEPYNEATEYKKNNVVRYGKNAYIALQDTQGNEPNATGDSEYWGLLAVGGVDGTVSSVNGKQGPNIVLTAEDVGAATLQDLQIMNDYYTSLMGTPNGIALLNAQGKPVDSDGNEVGGGSVNSVNNVAPDENGNILLTASNINTSDGISIQEEMANLKSSASSVKNGIANVIGEPLLPSDTGQQMVDKIQALKEMLASILDGSVTTTFTLQRLIMSLSIYVEWMFEILGTGGPINILDNALEDLQNLRTQLANELNNKGVYAEETEGLYYLVPKVNQIETGGVQYANGTVMNSTDILPFQYAGTLQDVSLRFVEITDIPFTPSKIVLSFVNSEKTIVYKTLYEENNDPFYPKTIKLAYFGDSTRGSVTTHNVKGDVLNAVVSENLIRLPSTAGGNANGTWEAWG